MKAAIKTGFAGTTIKFSNDFPSPSLKPTDKDSVLVQVHAGAINPVDYKVPKYFSGSVLGLDFCGKVTEAHPDSSFQVGDVVVGKAKGSLAEYALVSSKHIAKVPQGWSATDCAALPVAYLSALQCLQKGKIVPDDINNETPSPSEKSVLIVGASGGCGLAAVQLCAGIGVLRIVAICSGKNDEFVRKHGATEVVNYTNQSELDSFFAENKRKFDCVVDTATNSGAGEDYWNKSLELLKRDADDQQKIVGEYTALNGGASKWVRAFAGKQKSNETIIMANANGPDLELVLQLMDKAGAKPVTNVFDFDEKGVKEGFKMLKSRRTKGKIVFDIISSA